MTIISTEATVGASRIGYENLFDSANTIVATDEATGYEKENGYNWNLFDWWKPASTGTKYLTATFTGAVTADYFAVFGHNLHTYTDTIQLQYSTNGFSWSDATTAQAPSTGRVVFVAFDSISAAYWRVKYITTGPGVLGALSFGSAISLPYGMKIGFIPPPFARKTKYYDKSTSKGVFLPRSIEKMPGSIVISQENIDPVWMRDNWIPFLDHAETKPFFFSWDYDAHPNEAGFCRTQKDPRTTYNTPLYMETSVNASILTALDV